MKNIFGCIFLTILTSCFLFPFSFTFAPAFNLKMIMAALGLIPIGLNLLSKREIVIERKLFFVFLFGALVSGVSYFSVLYNNTKDYIYVSYFVSMLVWMSSAYFLIYMIKQIHGKISLEIVCNYFIVVAVGQCILSLLIYIILPLKMLVNALIFSADYFDKGGRLYGIGCALDVAGTRFSCILVMIAVLSLKLIREGNVKTKTLIYYILSFLVISVIGSIISRTTIVGLLLAILYTVFDSGIFMARLYLNKLRFYLMILLFLSLSIVGLTVLYNTNNEAKGFLRFGFEGFFSLVETGKWNVGSNNHLKTMYVFPETTETWLFGDGAMRSVDEFGNVDIFNFHKGTDVGYLRFIFYFGLLGLIIFSIYFILVAHKCISNFKQYKIMFLMILLINYIIWFKVATDIFLIFAPFLFFSDENYEEEL